MKRAFLIVLATVALAGSLRASGKEDLILWWDFERPEGAIFRDVSGHGRDGAAFDLGPGQIVLQGQERDGAAIELQGEGRNLVKSDAVDVGAFPGGSFTLEVWVRDAMPKISRGGNLGAVIAMQRTGVNVAWSLGVLPDGALRFFTNSGGAPSTHDTAPLPWASGVWYRVVLSCRADGPTGHYLIECYQDDRSVLSEKFEAPVPQMEGDGSFVVGGDHASTAPDRNFAGWIDEVRYFKSPTVPGNDIPKATKN